MSRTQVALEAERACLGTILMEPSFLPALLEHVRPADFSRDAHQRLLALIIERRDAGQPHDVLAICERLQQSGNEQDYGGVIYVSGLPEKVPHMEGLAGYAKMVQEAALRRRLAHTAAVLTEAATQAEDPMTALVEAERALQEVAGSSSSGKWSRLSRVVDDVLPIWKLRGEQAASGVLPGISTGFVDLDRMFGGLRKGDLVILAGRPAMGKSALALNIARSVAKGGVAAGMFSQEMPNEVCLGRFTATEAGIPYERLRDGIPAREVNLWQQTLDGLDRLAPLPIYLDDSGSLRMSDVRSRARRLQGMDPTLGLIVVDYLQLMKPEERGARENRERQIGAIGEDLKRLARDLDVPVLALAQLNRDCESRNDKRPLLSDLRESGVLEQAADVILMIYRDEMYNAESPDLGVAEVIVRKARHGKCGTVRVAFQPPFQRFLGLDVAHDQSDYR
jgi:replicative DNA helicase